MLLAACLALTATIGLAQDDPPGRVGRLADFNGHVSWWDHEAGQWAEAERNRPLSGGDRISTDASGRAELRVGSTALRVGNNTEVELLRLDDERMVFQLHSGSAALRVRSREVATEVELLTAEARLLPLRAGHYRVDRIDDTTWAGSWRGELQVEGRDGFVIGNGQRAELFRERRSAGAGELRHSWAALPADGFSSWVNSENQRDERSASTRYVSPEMTGAEDLDRNGRWEQHPEFGAIWTPLAVRAGWAPYSDGHWAWVRPWGWTWIDEAPWGFAPFHYGRWVSWHGRWGWVPGAWVPRPVYAPALVAWVGGEHRGVSLQIGGPNVGWVPLAPREIYRPHYRTTPIYVERMNPVPAYRWSEAPRHVPAGPSVYGNQGVPNAVTVVPGDTLVRRQPVGRVAVEVPRGGGAAPLVGLPAPAAPGPAPLSPRGNWPRHAPGPAAPQAPQPAPTAPPAALPVPAAVRVPTVAPTPAPAPVAPAPAKPAPAIAPAAPAAERARERPAERSEERGRRPEPAPSGRERDGNR